MRCDAMHEGHFISSLFMVFIKITWRNYPMRNIKGEVRSNKVPATI